VKNSVVLNLFAGPGAGKSTVCAGVFAELKWRGVDCEMATEYVKDKVWEESYKTIDCQTYIFGKQLHRLFRLRGKVDAIVTDSPLLLSLIYDKRNMESFKRFVLDECSTFQNINIFLTRHKPYNPNGRMQTSHQAMEIDIRIKLLLNEINAPFTEFVACRETVPLLADIVCQHLKKP